MSAPGAPLASSQGPIDWRATAAALAVLLTTGAVAAQTRSAAFTLAPGLAAAALWALSRSPRSCLVLAVGIAPATGGLARGVPLPGLRLSEALALLGAAGLLLGLARGRQLRFDRLDLGIAAFAAANVVLGVTSARANGTPYGPGAMLPLLAPVQYLLLVWAMRRTSADAALREFALACLAAGFVANGIVACLGAVSSGFEAAAHALTVEAVSNFQSYSGTNRVSGLFAHPQVLAGYMSTGVVFLVVWLTAAPPQRQGIRRLALVALGFAVAGMVLTAVLAACILVPVTCLLAVRRYRPELMGRALIAVGVAALVASPLMLSRVADQTSQSAGTTTAERSGLVPQSIAFRWDVWSEQFIPALSGHWLTGLGAEIPATAQWKSSESMYLLLIFRGGLPLLSVFLAVLGFVWWACRARRLAPPATVVGAGFVYAFVPVLLLMFLIQPYLNYGGISHTFWALAGLGLGAPAAGRAAWHEWTTARLR